jgi:hypothetical protein
MREGDFKRAKSTVVQPPASFLQNKAKFSNYFKEPDGRCGWDRPNFPAKSPSVFLFPPCFHANKFPVPLRREFFA